MASDPMGQKAGQTALNIGNSRSMEPQTSGATSCCALARSFFSNTATSMRSAIPAEEISRASISTYPLRIPSTQTSAAPASHRPRLWGARSEL